MEGRGDAGRGKGSMRAGLSRAQHKAIRCGVATAGRSIEVRPEVEEKKKTWVDHAVKGARWKMEEV